MTYVSTRPGSGYRHSAGQMRGRLARDAAALIANDYGSWREAIGEHPADRSADAVIVRLRSTARAVRGGSVVSAMQGE